VYSLAGQGSVGFGALPGTTVRGSNGQSIASGTQTAALTAAATGTTNGIAQVASKSGAARGATLGWSAAIALVGLLLAAVASWA
jgi:hypothetical protein